jgi:hypothetical protein
MSRVNRRAGRCFADVGESSTISDAGSRPGRASLNAIRRMATLSAVQLRAARKQQPSPSSSLTAGLEAKWGPCVAPQRTAFAAAVPAPANRGGGAIGLRAARSRAAIPRGSSHDIVLRPSWALPLNVRFCERLTTGGPLFGGPQKSAPLNRCGQQQGITGFLGANCRVDSVRASTHSIALRHSPNSALAVAAQWSRRSRVVYPKLGLPPAPCTLE